MKKPKNIPTYYKSKGTPIYRDTTSLPFLNGGPLNNSIVSNTETVDQDAMNAMMKARMATAAQFGNPAALRMVSPNPKTYDFGNGNLGTHFMTSADNYAVPMLQDRGGENLEYIENPPPSQEDIRFESPEEAQYFAENYKTVAPMVNNFLSGGPLVDRTDRGQLLPSIYASALGNYYAQGGMLKRADGSYSPRGLWDNIRDNAGSGKKPTKQMLAQEKKINREYRTGGQFPRPYSLPEDSFMQGGDNLHNSIYASSPAQYPAPYKYGGTFDMPRQQMYMPLDHVARYGGYQKNIYDEGGNIGDPPKDAWGRSLNDKYYGFDPKTKKYTVAPYKIEELRKQAAGVSKYDALERIQPQVAESTKPNIPPVEKLNIQNAVNERTAERDIIADKVKQLPLLTDEDKAGILMDPRKVDEYSYLLQDYDPGTIKQSTPQSTAGRAWDIVTNPFDAFEYAVRTGDVSNMPHNYNEMRMAGIDPSAGQGANAVGNTLNTFTNLFDAGDKVVRNVGEGNYGTAALEAMRFLPGARLDIGASKYIKELPRFSNAAESIQNAGRSVGSLVERAPSTRPTFTAQQRQNAELLSEWITDRNMPAEQLRDFVQRSPDWARLVDDYAAVTGNSQEINAFLSGMGSAPSRYTNPPIYAQADNLQASLGRINFRRAELPGRDQIASWDSNTFVRENFAGFKTKKGPLKTIQTALTDLDKKVGSFIEEKFGELKKPISITDIEKEVNTLLEKGVGVKKGDFKIRIAANPNGNNADIHLDIKDYLTKNKELLEKTYPGSDIDAWLNTVPDGFVNSGTISVPSTVNPNIQNRTFTEILSGKPRQTTYLHSDALSPIETPGLRKKGEFPFNNWDPRIKDNVLNNLGVSGEYNKAINETLKSRGYGLYSGGTGHLSQGAKRYVKEFLNNRVDIANPGQAQTFLEKLNDTETMRLVNEALQDRTKKLPEDVEDAIQNVIFKYKKKGGYLYNNPNIDELMAAQYSNIYDEGGQLYTYNNTNYKKEGDKWLKEMNGKYMPLTKGNIEQRYDVLNKNAKPVIKSAAYPTYQRNFDPLYDTIPAVSETTKIVVPKEEIKKTAAPDMSVKYNDRVAAQNRIIQETNPAKNYAIIDKNVDSAFYFNPQGFPLAGESIITGASNNDIDRGLSMKEWMNKTGNTDHDDYFAYLKRIKAQTTPAGAFTVGTLRTNTATDPSLIGRTYNNLFRPERAEFIRDSRIRDYGPEEKLFTLINEEGKGSSKAMHGTGNEERIAAFNTPGAKRDLSNGCINVNGKTVCFNTLSKGSGVFILPEESKNLVYPQNPKFLKRITTN